MVLLRLAMHRGVAPLALSLLFCAGGVRLEAQAAAAKTPPPPAPPVFKPTPEQLAIQAASEKELQREMDLLGIKALKLLL